MLQYYIIAIELLCVQVTASAGRAGLARWGGAAPGPARRRVRRGLPASLRQLWAMGAPILWLICVVGCLFASCSMWLFCVCIGFGLFVLLFSFGGTPLFSVRCVYI